MGLASLFLTIISPVCVAQYLLLDNGQGGTAGPEQFYAAAMGGEGSVILVGNAGDGTRDTAAVKLDKDGALLWEWQVTDAHHLL